MPEQKKPEDVTEESVVETEQSRRDFITKVIAGAGAAAIAGLVASAQEADAAVTAGKIEAGKFEQVQGMTWIKVGKMTTGFKLSLTGRQLGTALQGAGLLPGNANLDNATMTIEFSA